MVSDTEWNTCNPPEQERVSTVVATVRGRGARRLRRDQLRTAATSVTPCSWR